MKGTNEDGVWGNTERTLKVRILPAPWLTWWAYCLYAVAIVVILYFVFRFLRYKMRMQHEIQIGKMEKQKIQEINHLKLQFFTNITHELMTPLSIILASLENLKSGGDKRTLYTVMTANATRLMRLIQQVLEFRKVESGNLKICVSYGDISSFCAVVRKPLYLCLARDASFFLLKVLPISSLVFRCRQARQDSVQSFVECGEVYTGGRADMRPGGIGGRIYLAD